MSNSRVISFKPQKRRRSTKTEPLSITLEPTKKPRRSGEQSLEEEVIGALSSEATISEVNSEYMRGQPDFSASMRGYLIDWMITANAKLKLQTETLYLSVSLLDRYLSKRVISKSKLSALAVACLTIATKYEETYAVSVSAYATITGNTKASILQMELDVLDALEYSVTVPYACTFVNHFTRNSPLHVRNMAHYFSELALTDYRMLKYNSLEIAAASVFLASRVLRHRNKGTDDLKNCALDLLLLAQTSTYSGVKAKFAAEEYQLF